MAAAPAVERGGAGHNVYYAYTSVRHDFRKDERGNRECAHNTHTLCLMAGKWPSLNNHVLPCPACAAARPFTPAHSEHDEGRVRHGRRALPCTEPSGLQTRSAIFAASPAAPLPRPAPALHPAPPDAYSHAPPATHGCSPACISVCSPRCGGPASPVSTAGPPRSPASASPSHAGTGDSSPFRYPLPPARRLPLQPHPAADHQWPLDGEVWF